jgi:hypothetical protein
MYCVHNSWQILMKPEYSGQICEKYSNIKFHENSSSGSWVVSCGRTDRQTDRQTDMTKLIVAFRNFANPSKNSLTELIVKKEKGQKRCTEVRRCCPVVCDIQYVIFLCVNWSYKFVVAKVINGTYAALYRITKFQCSAELVNTACISLVREQIKDSIK